MNKFLALQLVEDSEGLSLTAYQDPAGVWTIGYGHTPSFSGQSITLGYAQVLLKNDLAHFEMGVTNLTHDVPTSDNQYSAMVDFAYNLGLGALGGSTLLRLHRRGDYLDAANEFLKWDHAHVDGQLVVLRGLLIRRQKEQMLYLSNALINH